MPTPFHAFTSRDPALLLNRRQALKLCGLQFTALATASPMLFSPKSTAADDSLQPLNRFPRMVQELFVRQVEEALHERRARLNRLQTPGDAERYTRSVRERIAASFGPFPERTPLHPRVTGRVERDVYDIENVIFESRPGFLVTANLYLPKGRRGPLPGVVGTCGHSSNGKAAEAYQSFAQGLARQGYVTLVYDPIGQGERLQYVGEDLRSTVGVGVREHLYAGNQQFLVGEFIGAWRAWDGIRALDYLLTRPEVDPRQVGVTGNSGGGTMTTWLCGVESRWTMAAPSCFVTSFQRNLENELPADTEQCPPKALALGLDHEDFLAALAPKPIIILAKERDYFDARGAEEAYARLKRLYTLLGAPENISLFIGPTYHGYSEENREAMYRWFNHATGVSDRSSEPELVIEDDATLQCAPGGQVSELGSKPVFAFTRERSRALAQTRPPLSGPALKQAVRSVLKLTPPPDAPPFRILRPLRGRGYPRDHFTTYLLETEPLARVAVYRLSHEPHYSRPPRSNRAAALYVSHHSADDELRTDEWLRQSVESDPERPFFACDPRGVGESRPDTCGENSFLEPYGSDYFYAVHSLMLDRPYVGQKTLDVLAILNWLAALGHREIHLLARGWGALPATFAALLSDQVATVTLKNALSSYQAIAESEEYRWPLSALLPDALRQFDLPDCYAALESKALRLVEPWDALGRPVENQTASTFSITSTPRQES